MDIQSGVLVSIVASKQEGSGFDPLLTGGLSVWGSPLQLYTVAMGLALGSPLTHNR